jgi:hypothetical protein
MKTIHVTKTDWNITATYTYREDGVCLEFKLPEDIAAKKVKPFITIALMPFASVVILPITDKTIKVEEELNLSFEYAWAKYNYKNGKIRAKEAWAKLKDSEKILALKYMPVYERALMGTSTAKLYFERYCKFKKWEDAE